MSDEDTQTCWVAISTITEEFDLSDDTVRRMIARGEIEARRFGPRLIRVNRASVLANARPLAVVA